MKATSNTAERSSIHACATFNPKPYLHQRLLIATMTLRWMVVWRKTMRKKGEQVRSSHHWAAGPLALTHSQHARSK